MEGAVTGMEAITTALTTSFTEVASSLTGLIGNVLPIALPVVGGVLVVGIGIKIFKKVVSKQYNRLRKGVQNAFPFLFCRKEKK